MLWAMPHSIEAAVKPATQTMRSFLMPNRAASHPTGAVITAAATT